MDTTGESAAAIAAHIVLLALFGFVAVQLLRGRARAFPGLTIGAVLVIGIPSLLQFAAPGLTAALQRDPAATLQHGQWWRPVTSLLAQDGGIVATLFNLVVVAYVVLVAEWSWGRARTLVAFLGASVIVNLIALAWGARGGGSSFATDGLMLALTAWAALSRGIVPLRIVAVLQLAVALVLVILGDAHGVAMLVGAVIGIGAALVDRARAPRSAAAR